MKTDPIPRKTDLGRCSAGHRGSTAPTGRQTPADPQTRRRAAVDQGVRRGPGSSCSARSWNRTLRAKKEGKWKRTVFLWDSVVCVCVCMLFRHRKIHHCLAFFVPTKGGTCSDSYDGKSCDELPPGTHIPPLDEEFLVVHPGIQPELVSSEPGAVRWRWMPRHVTKVTLIELVFGVKSHLAACRD